VNVRSRLALDQISAVAKKQVPYATAVALTAVASKARDQIKAELPHEFTIRRPWTASGIRAERALKRDWPHTKSRVGSVDPYMVDFEKGGPHRLEGTRSSGPKFGQRTTAFAIPMEIRKAAGLQVTQVIPIRYWPSRLARGTAAKAVRRRRGKPRPFLATINGKTGVFVRTGDTYDAPGKRGTKKRDKITMLWALTKRPSKVPRKQWLTKTTLKVVNQHLVPEFKAALVKAMETAR
jgi:hypothetical protein